MHTPENIERREEKESGSVKVKLKGHSVIEFHLTSSSEIILESSRSLCDYDNMSKECHTDHIQKNRR